MTQTPQSASHPVPLTHTQLLLCKAGVWQHIRATLETIREDEYTAQQTPGLFLQVNNALITHLVRRHSDAGTREIEPESAEDAAGDVPLSLDELHLVLLGLETYQRSVLDEYDASTGWWSDMDGLPPLSTRSGKLLRLGPLILSFTAEMMRRENELTEATS